MRESSDKHSVKWRARQDGSVYSSAAKFRALYGSLVLCRSVELTDAVKTLALVVFILGTLPNDRAFASVTFLGDWGDFGSQFQTNAYQSRLPDGTLVGWVAGSGANHWRMVQERGIDRLQVQQDPTSPKGGAVLQVEVRPGDYLGYSGERAEVSHMLSPTGGQYWVTAQTGHEVYGISIKLDSNWPLDAKKHENQWGAFLQLHSPDEFHSPPSFSLHAENQFHAQLLAGDLIDANGQRRGVTPVPFTNGELRRGQWVQFLIDVVWAYDNSGALTVYRRDAGETAFTNVLTLTNQPTLQFDSQIPNSQNTDPASGHTYSSYWKTGFYRSITPEVTSRLWLGPVVRGTSLQEVAVAAFGKY